MLNTSITSGKLRLLATVAPLAVVLATPVYAQTVRPQEQPNQSTANPAPTPNTTANDDQANTGASTAGDIVVTGSILRRTDTETVSPVTTITAEALDQRGISTVQDAIQMLSANNGPALTNAFSANGAFAAGASAVSLRGLSTNSTLVLFDGLRAAYYPLADDGSRNFVDLNTIPDDIVERVEVLRDGASASYGADAIAGVVNIITKKEFKGVGGRAEAGISDRGDAPSYRLTLTAGVGDLEDNGYNAYISGFYYKSEKLMNKQRPYPFNSDDLRNVRLNGGQDQGNTVVNGVQSDGSFSLSTAGNFIVRPYDAANTTAQGGYVNLSNDCGLGTSLTLTAAQRGANFPGTVCQYDYTNLYGTITPNIERFGGSGRVTAKVGDTMEGYVEVNFLQSTVDYTGFPATFYGTAPTGVNYPQFRTSGAGGTGTIYAAGSNFLTLPVYVCAARVNCATAADRRLNPNNPFAAAGQVARIFGRNTNETTYNETRNRAYRAALGLRGNITDGIGFEIGATAMHTDLRRFADGYVRIQNLLDVIADGSYNFINPSATPQSVQDYLTPANVNIATSDQLQLQGTVQTTLFELPGGPLQLGVGGSIRYEAVDAPSANSDANGPTQRYFTLNAFGTTGSRNIYSAFAELSAPVFDQLEIDLSGRYDNYSSGQDAFSPKAGVKFKPIRQLALRGTYSRGFRIPSFGEANALPTTGYVTNAAGNFNDAYLAQYTAPGSTTPCSVRNFTTACPTYIRSSSYGSTTLASPNLQPEKSRNFTGGVIFEPFRRVSFTVDYFNIKKTGAITSPDTGSAVLAYYAGTAIDPTITVIPDAPDVNFPNAKPRIAFVQAQLVNADTIRVSGLDFQALGTFDVGPMKWTSSVEASHILKLSTTVNGVEQRYDGTLGNFNLTAGSGTPKWHGSFQNTFDFGTFALTQTANFFGGYDLSAMDQGDDYKDCGRSDGIYCRVNSYITVDMNAQVKVNDQFTFYVTALNILDRLPPIDPVTYGAHLYNPVQGGNGILGRYWKAGIRFGF